MMRQKQKGLTAISWVVVLVLVAIQVVMAMRIAPVYMNYGTVKSIINDLTTDQEAKGASPKKLRGMINKRLQINNLTALLHDKDSLKFKKASDGTIINIHYQDRGPIYGNLEFVATFNHEVKVSQR